MCLYRINKFIKEILQFDWKTHGTKNQTYCTTRNTTHRQKPHELQRTQISQVKTSRKNHRIWEISIIQNTLGNSWICIAPYNWLSSIVKEMYITSVTLQRLTLSSFCLLHLIINLPHSPQTVSPYILGKLTHNLA